MKDELRSILAALGEDPDRDGLRETPARVAESLRTLTRGYGQDPAELLGGSAFDAEYDDMVVVRDIDFYSLCEHHLLPFYGRAHVGYLPDGRCVGLSKIPRLVDLFARRLQVQERLTHQVAGALMEYLRPKGVAVVLEAFHLCVAMRGVEKQNAVMTTSAMRGIFREDARTRREFLSLIRSGAERRP
ncbi:MAG: GTP cyclohydrolase I FolE [Candidatus Krumholzibacteriota bacterium]|nr:GTP cyclohydrolase I FolE [Candidatus Krumholzibacteriota bacterium]